jgi:hypothetical protein
MESNVVTFTFLYRTTSILLTFSFLPLLYENPVEFCDQLSRVVVENWVQIPQHM